MMNHDEMIAVIQAHKDGKEIEYLHNGEWTSYKRGAYGPRFNFAFYMYRIKPEPKTIWVNEYANRKSDCAHSSEEDAKNSAGRYVERVAVEYREVIK